MEIVRILYVDDNNFARVVKIITDESGAEVKRFALDVDGNWLVINKENYPNVTKISTRTFEAIDFIC